MTDQPKLSETEWAIVIELLQRELEDLPVEIHHTRTNSFREELVTRRQTIQNILERLRPVSV